MKPFPHEATPGLSGGSGSFENSLSCFRRGSKTVADSMHGFEELGLRLLPQLENMGVDGAGGRILIVAPDFLQELLARKHLVRVFKKEPQQVEFRLREIDRPAEITGLARGQIERDP